MNERRFQLVSYLAGLISIMESKEDAGLPKGGMIAREYERAYTELRDLIKAEEKETK